MEELKNHGVLIGIRPTDYIGGTLDYKVVLPSGDWRPFLPSEERQSTRNGDSMACVSYSALNGGECQHKLQTGREINFSDRFTARDSGTTRDGNYLYKVADSIRAGVVLAQDYPTPEEFTWESFHQTIPADVYNKRIKYDVAYEWIKREQIAHHLKHAPIQIIITSSHPNHAVLAVYQEGDTVYYFDSYSPFIKTIKLSDVYPDALKIVWNFSMSNTQFVHKAGTNEFGFYVPATSEESIKDKALNYGVNITNADGSIDFSKAKDVSGL
jgi:hypothetical protein